jgi:uncharacterized protein
MIILLTLAIVAGACIVLVSQQSRWIYYPRQYEASTWDALPSGVEPLRFRTNQGAQVAFYVRPESGGDPQRLWLLCTGQGGLALEWLDSLPLIADREAGFLLLDYPGCGFCEGSCTPGRILASCEGAVEALRSHLGLPSEQMAARLGVLGYSFGTGVAAQYAAKHPVRRVVLAAPYTSLVDVANHMYIWPCGQFLWHRYNTEARFAEIAAQQPRPSVLLVHGAKDDCIPVAMSAHLAAPYPGWIDRLVLPNGDHNSVVEDALRSLRGP